MESKLQAKPKVLNAVSPSNGGGVAPGFAVSRRENDAWSSGLLDQVMSPTVSIIGCDNAGDEPYIVHEHLDTVYLKVHPLAPVDHDPEILQEKVGNDRIPVACDRA